MVSVLLMLLMVGSPGELSGVYCDEVAFELMRYMEDTGSLTRSEIDKILKNCEGWEERYEEALQEGKVDPLTK